MKITSSDRFYFLVPDEWVINIETLLKCAGNAQEINLDINKIGLVISISQSDQLQNELNNKFSPSKDFNFIKNKGDLGIFYGIHIICGEFMGSYSKEHDVCLCEKCEKKKNKVPYTIIKFFMDIFYPKKNELKLIFDNGKLI